MTDRNRSMAKRSAVRTSTPVVQDSSAVERVIGYIISGIRDGRFAPGQRLIEGELQAMLQVSRGPVREAVRRLAAENILQLELHKGARLRQLTPEEINAIYDVREVLEGLAARLAAQNASFPDDQLQALEREFDRRFDGTTRHYLAYNEEFHRLIVRSSGNTELIRLVENLQIPTFLLLLHILVDALSIKRARAEHRPIVKAILKRDGREAERTMRAHIRSTKTFVIKVAAKRFRTG
ncbi:MAG: FCD domain-containing protein [Rhizobiales bacterium]|nr:FCD domain-containing protein [Hyphomicrobiales bacterium]